MFKIELIILNLASRDSRIEDIIATFKTLQNKYKVNLQIDHFLNSSIVRVVANFYFVLSSIFSRRLRKLTKSIIVAYTYKQQITLKKKTTLAT